MSLHSPLSEPWSLFEGLWQQAQPGQHGDRNSQWMRYLFLGSVHLPWGFTIHAELMCTQQLFLFKNISSFFDTKISVLLEKHWGLFPQVQFHTDSVLQYMRRIMMHYCKKQDDFSQCLGQTSPQPTHPIGIISSLLKLLFTIYKLLALPLLLL